MTDQVGRMRSRIVAAPICVGGAGISGTIVARDEAVSLLADKDVRIGERAVTAATVAPAPVPPCGARGVAVTANTSQVVAHASSLIDAF